jgi:hypothetical protein
VGINATPRLPPLLLFNLISQRAVKYIEIIKLDPNYELWPHHAKQNMKKRPSDFAEMAIFSCLRKELCMFMMDDTFCDFAER